MWWEGQGKRGDMGGSKYVVDGSRFRLEMYSPCRACLLNSSIYAFIHIQILPNPDRNLGSTSNRIYKPVHLYKFLMPDYFDVSEFLLLDYFDVSENIWFRNGVKNHIFRDSSWIYAEFQSYVQKVW